MRACSHAQLVALLSAYSACRLKLSTATAHTQTPTNPAFVLPAHTCSLTLVLLCRDKARLLLAEALALAVEDVEDGDPAVRAVDVEKAMLAQNGGVNQKYKAKLRSLAFNLKDANNPDLRRRVLSAEVSGVQPR